MPVDAAELRSAFSSRRLVLDGATGTELDRRGVATPLPLWSAGALDSHPRVVEAIHSDYIKAGADVIVANTFRTNPRTLNGCGRLGDGLRLNAVAVNLVRRAAGNASDRTVYVAASIAPVEDCYHPERVPDAATLADEHGRMADWLAEAAPDLVWIETMNTIREARAAAAACAGAGLSFACSFVTTETGDLLSGEPLEEAAAAVARYEPLALGLNCIPPAGITNILPRLRTAFPGAIAAYAHLGNPEPISGWSFSSSMSPSEYAGHVREWLALGATIVGGCCGTNPDHIRAVREALADIG